MVNNKQNQILGYLMRLGLSEEEAISYVVLVESGPLTLLKLARKTRINRTRVYRTVERMKEKRLIKEIKEEYSTLVEAEGIERIKEMLRESQRISRELTNTYDEVVEYITQLSNKESSDTIVHYYRGSEGIKQMVWNTLKATSEIVGYTYLSLESAVGSEFTEQYYEEFYRRNLRMRDILSDNYLRSAREVEDEPRAYRRHPHWLSHVQSRYVSEQRLVIPHQMDIYDDTVGIYSWREGEIFGVEITNPKVANFQRQLFEQTWKSAKPHEDQPKQGYNNKLQVDTQYLLSRTTLPLSGFKGFLGKVQRTYPKIGKIIEVTPLVFGYEDANFALETEWGKYVLKIFASDMDRARVRAHGRAIQIANQKKIPSPVLLVAKTGEVVTEIHDQYVMITKMFEGTSLANQQPTMADVLVVTKAVAKLNLSQENLEVGYDSWGNANLMREYKRDQDQIAEHVKDIIAPVMEKLRKVDLSQFCTGLIHGDIQPNHILKNVEGQYCILDFGVARRDAVVYEVSTVLAWLALRQDNWRNYDRILSEVVATYTKVVKLGPEEVAVIPLLIAASYASYYFRTSILMSEGDNSEETREWNEKSKALLMLAIKKI